MVIREIKPRNRPAFVKGDWIVHAFYGVGRVLGREIKIMEGEENEYLRIKTNDSYYWLLIENMNADYIRPLASLDQINKALSLIRKQPDMLAKDYRIRQKEIARAVKDVALEVKICMIRDLTERKREKSLNVSESQTLFKLTTNFLTEWSLVTGEEIIILEKNLLKALKARSKKISTW